MGTKFLLARDAKLTADKAPPDLMLSPNESRGKMNTIQIRSTLLAISCSGLLVACSAAPEPPQVQAAAEAVEQVVANPDIINPSFEDEWKAWDELPASGDLTAISDDAHDGDHSAKVTDAEGRFQQAIQVEPNTNYEVSAYVRGPGQIGVDLPAETLTAKTDGEGDLWLPARLSFNTGDASQVVIFGSPNGDEARFDDFTIAPIAGN